MGIFSWLARKPRRAEPYIIHYAIEGSGDFSFDIVGEASYQENLNRICNGKINGAHEIKVEALLMEEPSNPHDPNAVRVVIDGRTVGYLPRNDAYHYRKYLQLIGISGRAVLVDAMITGGWDYGKRGAGNYGVRLDMDMPPAFLPF